MIEEILTTLIQGLVENPQSVSVASHDEGKIVKINVVVDNADIGRVIGKDGKITNALSVIINAIMHKTEPNKKYIIKINEGQR